MYLENYQTSGRESSGQKSPPHLVENLAENEPYFLIQGNKSSTAHSTGLCESELQTDKQLHEDRLEKYAAAHRRSVDMSGWILKNRLDKNERYLATELKECGDYLIFRDYFTINQVKLHGMVSCKKHLLCPLCAIRRGAKCLKAYLDRLEVIKQSYGKIRAYLVTFTVKNGDDLAERYNHLQTSMKNYNLKRSRANNSKKDLPVEANKALGAVWSYEFKRGAGSGCWHPHAHAIWLCYDEPNGPQLQKEWLAITGDSHIVNVTPFYNQDDVVGGFLEVFKYAVKFSDMPLQQNFEGYQVLNGRRLVSSFGVFRGVQVPDSLVDEPLEALPYWEMFYRYQTAGKYKLEKSKMCAAEYPF